MSGQAPMQANSLIATLAQSANLEPNEFRQTLMATVMPGNVSNEQFTAFLMVAKKYDLNPITKEIYAFPSRGGIQPIVSIDGWLKIINSHEQFDGMEFTDNLSDGRLVSVTCKIFRKDREHPTEVTEYMDECKDQSGKSEPWKRWPARMLRHKATIQAARYAFGLSGIYDPDEAERIDSVPQQKATERVIDSLPIMTGEQFEKEIEKCRRFFAKGGNADTVINTLKSKYDLTLDQEISIKDLAQESEAA